MANEPERITRLQSFGLTENQAKAYLALLELGRATASALNKVSGVPRNKVYSVVEELNEKGLVDMVLEDPIVFEPRPIGQYLDMLVNELDARKGDLSQQKNELQETFRIRRVLADDDLQVGTFRIFKGRRAVLQQHARMDAECKQIIRLLGTPNTPTRIIAGGHVDDYTKSAEHPERRYEIYVPLTNENRDAVRMLSERVGDGLRISYGLPGNVVVKVVDDNAVMFTHYVPDSESVSQGDDVGVWTDNPVFLRIAKVLLAQAGTRSQTVVHAEKMLEGGESPPRFDILNDPEEVQGAIRRAMAATTGESMIVLPAADLQRLVESDGLGTNQGRLRILTDAGEEQLKAMQIPAQGLVVRRLDDVPARFGIYGDRVIRHYGLDAEGAQIAGDGHIAMVTNVPAAVAEARDHFDRLWNAGEPIEVTPAPVAKGVRVNVIESEAEQPARREI